MKLFNRVLTYMMAFLLLNASTAQAQEFFMCSSVFGSLQEITKGPWKPGSAEVEYTIMSGRQKGYSTNFRGAEFLPERDINKRVVIVINEGHVYLQYKDHRLDSKGTAGLSVTSFLKESDLISGDVAIVMYDLPPAVLEKLDAVIENFKSRSNLTCVALTCNYLAQVSAEDFPGLSYRTSSLFSDLIAMKNQGKNIDIVSLNGRKLDESMARASTAENGGMLTFGALSAVVAFVISGVLWLQYESLEN